MIDSDENDPRERADASPAKPAPPAKKSAAPPAKSTAQPSKSAAAPPPAKSPATPAKSSAASPPPAKSAAPPAKSAAPRPTIGIPESQVPDSKVTVTVDDAHMGDVDALADQLRAEGMTVDQVLGAVGIITGSVPAGQRSSLGGIEGVAAVEEETVFQLPPPDSEIQ